MHRLNISKLLFLCALFFLPLGACFQQPVWYRDKNNHTLVVIPYRNEKVTHVEGSLKELAYLISYLKQAAPTRQLVGFYIGPFYIGPSEKTIDFAKVGPAIGGFLTQHYIDGTVCFSKNREVENAEASFFQGLSVLGQRLYIIDHLKKFPLGVYMVDVTQSLPLLQEALARRGYKKCKTLTLSNPGMLLVFNFLSKISTVEIPYEELCFYADCKRPATRPCQKCNYFLTCDLCAKKHEFCSALKVERAQDLYNKYNPEICAVIKDEKTKTYALKEVPKSMVDLRRELAEDPRLKDLKNSTNRGNVLVQIGIENHTRKVSLPLICSECGKNEGPALHKKGRSLCHYCTFARYCSQECQARAWQNHKAFCKDVRKAFDTHKEVESRSKKNKKQKHKKKERKGAPGAT